MSWVEDIGFLHMNLMSTCWFKIPDCHQLRCFFFSLSGSQFERTPTHHPSPSKTRWWFQIDFYFYPYLGNDPIGLYLSIGWFDHQLVTLHHPKGIGLWKNPPNIPSNRPKLSRGCVSCCCLVQGSWTFGKPRWSQWYLGFGLFMADFFQKQENKQLGELLGNFRYQILWS